MRRAFLTATTVLLLALGTLQAPARAAEPAPSTLKATAVGQGPVLVFLPGAGATRASWMPIARSFVDRYRIVVADLPGHGESPMLEPLTLRRVAEELEKLIAEQKSDSVILVGQAVGGLVALQVAANRPPWLRGLAIINVAPSNPLNEDQRRMMLRALDERYEELLALLYRQASLDSARSLQLHAQATLVPPATIKAYIREGIFTDLGGRMKDLPIPVLVIVTERMWPKGEDWAAVANRFGLTGIPRLQVVRVANSGSFVTADQPDSVRVWVGAFADSVLKR